MISVITFPTDEGNVEATRLRDVVWEINYPWFSERFAGSVAEVRARIKRTVKNMEANHEA